ncbi:MAG: hypothetical protein ACRBN8_12140 [Nannocystales bacterium]
MVASLALFGCDLLKQTSECAPVFCAENPGADDCIQRCEDDPAVDGCWYQCADGQDADCWSLETSCEPDPAESEGATTAADDTCSPLFCADDPDATDCIERCEDDPTVDGCWYQCADGQDSDCWNYEVECPDPDDDPTGATTGADEPEPDTHGATTGTDEPGDRPDKG